MELAICKYCGQIVATEVPENATKEEAIEIGTLNCNCVMAQEYQRMKESAAKAKIELEDMLLKDDEIHNIKAVDRETFDLLLQGIDIMAKDKIYKITVQLNMGGKVDIKACAGGKFSLQRTVPFSNKREV